MNVKYSVLLALGLLLSGCNEDLGIIDHNPPLTPESKLTTYTQVDCSTMLPDEAVAELTPNSTCGYLQAPETYQVNGFNLSDNKIKLAVVKLASTASTAKNDPVVYLEGGPGSGATNHILRFAKGNVIKSRDVYLVDQRGTGLSTPSLTCPEFEGEPTQLKSCYDRFAKSGVNLDAYRSVHSALDFIELRKALGLESWNLYGLSYGTRLATTILRQDSSGVRSVVLDGMFPIEVNGIGDSGWVNYEVLNQILATCSISENCPNDLQARIESTVDRFVNKGQFAYAADFVLQLMASVANPRLVELVKAKEAEANNVVAMPTLEIPQSAFSLGMTLSTVCAEEYPFLGSSILSKDNQARWNGNITNVIATLTQNHFGALNCPHWPVSAASEIETKAVTSQLPVLLLNGQNDTQTPVSWGKIVADNLPNAKMVTHPSTGHGQIFAGDACVDQITESFLNDPNANLDSTCIAEAQKTIYL